MVAAAPPFYSGLRRRLAVVAAGVVLAGLFQVLRVSARPVTTILLQLPPTTHLLTGRPTIRVPRTPAAVPRLTALIPVPGPDPVLPPPDVPAAADPPATAVRDRAPAPGLAPTEPPAATPPPAGAAAPPAPPPVAQPKSGVYPYRYTVGDASEDGAVTVAAGGAGADVETERVGSTTRTRSLQWSAADATITASDYGAGTCRWSPALTSWRLPLTTGAAWTTSASCPFSGGRLSEAEAAKVDGLVSTTVGAERVEAWVIERTTTITEAVSGVTLTTETQSTELFAPAYGLVVFEDGRTATPNADGTVTATDSAVELLSLEPR